MNNASKNGFERVLQTISLSEATRQTDIIEATCEFCGKQILRAKWRLERFARAFCSQKCYHATRQQRPYVQWRQGQRHARKAINGHFQLQPGNVIHHHDGDNRNNQLSNLAVFKNQADHMAHHHGVTPVKPLWDGRSL